MEKHKPTYKELEKTVAQNQFTFNALAELVTMTGKSRNKLNDFVLNKVVEFSKSEYGFLGLVDENQQDLSIISWSEKTLAACNMQNTPSKYIVNKYI